MTDSEAHYRKMTETPVSRLILNLGIPTTISMLITSIYNMADTYFVGTLGESAQAATGILFTVQAIMQGLAFMLGHGAGTYVSRALADRDADKATMYISTSFFTGMGLGLVIGVPVSYTHLSAMEVLDFALANSVESITSRRETVVTCLLYTSRCV